MFVGAGGQIADGNAATKTSFEAAGGWLCKRGNRLPVAAGRRWQDISKWLPSRRNDTQQQCALVLDLVNEHRRCAALEILPVQGAMADVLTQHPALAICTLTPGARDRIQALQEVHAGVDEHRALASGSSAWQAWCSSPGTDRFCDAGAVAMSRQLLLSPPLAMKARWVH